MAIIDTNTIPCPHSLSNIRTFYTKYTETDQYQKRKDLLIQGGMDVTATINSFLCLKLRYPNHSVKQFHDRYSPHNKIGEIYLDRPPLGKVVLVYTKGKKFTLLDIYIDTDIMNNLRFRFAGRGII